MSNSLFEIIIDDSGQPRPTDEIERERQIAIIDLIEENSFKIIPRAGQSIVNGPYRLNLAIKERRLIFTLTTKDDLLSGEIHLSLGPFRQIFKDYIQIYKSYFDAIKSLPPSQIEAIDMARRGIHNEGAELLCERLMGKAEIDIDTARRLFTLIFVLYLGDEAYV